MKIFNHFTPLISINTFCFIAFLIQLFYVGTGQLSPSKPLTTVEKLILSEIEFQVVFKMCVNKYTNEDETFKKIGYKDLEGYFIGQSIFNTSVIGWAGHRENGDAFGTVEGKVLKVKKKPCHIKLNY